jgi:hypothetical protein
MAYRPPSQSRYANMTAPPPPGPFSGRRQQSQPQPQQPLPQLQDEWTHVSRKRREPIPVSEPIETLVQKTEDFPALGAPTMPKKTWGSTESMAERMKKKMEEEELERLEKEKRKEEEKQASTGGFVPSNIISHQNLMRRFKEEEADTFEEEYHDELNTDGYGYSYEAHTPEYHYENDYEDDYS